MCISRSAGILMVPQKHREALKFIYNSGFYIAINVYPNFGEGFDGQAIKKRLKVFQTKSSKHKDTSVTDELRVFFDKPIYIWGGSGTHTTCNKLFETTINSWILVTEKSILDAAGVADPPLCILGELSYKK